MNLFQQSKLKRHALIIKDHVIRYVASKEPDLLTIEKSRERYLPHGVIVNGQVEDKEIFLTILNECVEEWKIKKQSIQFCMPSQHTIVRTHSIDGTVPDDEVRGQLYLELGETLLLPFDDPIFDFKVLGMRDGQKEILLFASRESVMNQYIEVFKEVGIKPNAADVSSLATYRLFYDHGKVTTGTYIIQAQIDTMLTTITIFKDHYPLFLSTVPSELDREGWVVESDGEITALTWSQGDELIQEQVEEQFQELQKVINFYQFNVLKGEGEIAQLSVCGDHPYLSMYIDALKEKLSLEVVTVNVNTKYEPSERFYDAVGLALKKEVYS